MPIKVSPENSTDKPSGITIPQREKILMEAQKRYLLGKIDYRALTGIRLSHKK